MTLPADFLIQLRAAYPKRLGGNGWSAVPRLLAAETDWDMLMLGTQNYARFCGRTGKTGTELVQQARTFYGRDKWWQEYAEMDLRTPAQIADDTRWQRLEDRAHVLGFTTVDRVRGYSVALAAVEAAERARSIEVVRSLRIVKAV